MYADEHGVAHFHAHYEGATVVIGVQPIAILAGSIRGRGLAMVMEWATKHQAELAVAWTTIQRGGKPNKIEPLD